MSTDAFTKIQKYNQLGWHLTPLKPNSKQPTDNGWNAVAQGSDISIWQDNPNLGVGLLHTLSNTCCIDVDNVEATKKWLTTLPDGYAITYEELRQQAAIYTSGKANREKFLFRVPDSISPSDLLSFKAPNGICEFRCATAAGKTVQDVLPPTIHPEIKQPYRWINLPDELPELPGELRSLWLKQSAYMRERMSIPSDPSGTERYGVVQAFNEMIDETCGLTGLLTGKGYMQQGYRFLHPKSQSRIPGLVLFSNVRGYSHNETDALAHSRIPGKINQPFDAFDAYAILYHDGDIKQASSDAAKIDAVKAKLDAADADLLANGNKSAENLIRRTEETARSVPIARLTPIEQEMENGPAIPLDLIFTDDAFGKFVEAIVQRTKRRNNPVAALANAFAVISLASGGAIRGHDDESMDMFLLLVGDSTRGKSETMRAARTALPDSLNSAYLDSIVSKAGLEDRLIESPTFPALLAAIDEVGFLLRIINSDSIRDKTAQELRQMLLTVKAATRYTTRPKAGAPGQTLNYPLMSLLGSSTVESLKGGLKRSDVLDGLGGRINAFNCDVHASRKQSRIKSIPVWVYQQFEAILQLVFNPDASVELQKPIRMPFTPEVYEFIDQKDDEIYNMTGENKLLHTRKLQNAEGFAMCRALFNDPSGFQVTLDDIQLAYEIANRNVNYLAWLMDGYLSETVEQAAIEQLIRKLDEFGGDYHKSDLLHNRCNRYKALNVVQKKLVREEIRSMDCIQEYKKKLSSGQFETRWRLTQNPSWLKSHSG